MKRVFIGIALLLLSARVVADNRSAAGRFDLVEATIPSIQTAIQNDIITAEQLVQMYLARIAAYNAKTTATHLNSYIHVNRGRSARGARSQQGARQWVSEASGSSAFPIILKDNIDTRDMPTTGGSVALAGSFPQSDAFITRKLREPGAIILGKATMTEFANFLTNGMPAGYSSLGGYGYNPYDPRPDPRTALDALVRPLNDGRPVLTPGGSSSGPGIAVAANLAAVGIGTETSGSILSPGTANVLVGIKPTVGLISRDGIIPITADQDTAGPLARTVSDAAIVLGVIAGFDPNDPATARVPDARQLLQRLHAVPRRARAAGRAHRGAAVSGEPRGGHEQRDCRADGAGRDRRCRCRRWPRSLGAARRVRLRRIPAGAVAAARRC